MNIQCQSCGLLIDQQLGCCIDCEKVTYKVIRFLAKIITLVILFFLIYIMFFSNVTYIKTETKVENGSIIEYKFNYSPNKSNDIGLTNMNNWIYY